MELREPVNQVGGDKASHNPENGAAYPHEIQNLDIDEGISCGKKHEKDRYGPIQLLLVDLLFRAEAFQDINYKSTGTFFKTEENRKETAYHCEDIEQYSKNRYINVF